MHRIGSLRLRRLLLLSLASTAIAGAAPSPAAAEDALCSKYASTQGDDAGAGTAGAPLRTAAKLVNSLAPGEVGCLRGGTYDEDVKVARGGTGANPTTLRSHPGERATIVGRFYIAQGADNVTIAELDLDGRNSDLLPSPTVNADNATFRGNDVTNRHTAICFVLGGSWGDADGTSIEGNRIHNCGKLPSQNKDHGIYVSGASDTRIVDNWIYDNADRGIQLYPSAQRTIVRRNVIDGNGEGVIFSGDGGVSSNDNVVENNVITNSRIRYNVESFYPSGTPSGRGNVVRNNCINGGSRDDGTNGGVMSPDGYSLSNNKLVDPQYQNRGDKNFALRSDSPCRELLGGDAGPGPGPATEPQPAPSPQPAPRPDTSPAPRPAPQPRRRGHAVTLSVRPLILSSRSRAARRGLPVLITGYVAPGRRDRAERVVIQIRRDGHWRTLTGGRLQRDDHFVLTPVVPTSRRLVSLRARVPGVGRSKIFRLRLP